LPIASDRVLLQLIRPQTERILAAALTQRLTLSSDGAYQPLIEGMARRNARVVHMLRYCFGSAD